MSQILTKLSNINRETLSPNFYETSPMLSGLLAETDGFVEASYKEFIKEYTSGVIHEAIEQSIKNKAHFERSLFVRLGYEFFRPNWKSIKYYLISTELKYASLVVTDDIFDDNSERMGSQSIQAEFGSNFAIAIAAILKSLSSIAFHNQVESSNQLLLTNDEIIHIHTYEGQLLDLETSKMPIDGLNESEYLDLIKKTTAEDIGLCFESGGILAGCNEIDANHLRNAGTQLGVAMQIRDDVLDYINDSSLINKESFLDFNGKRLRLPVYLAYKFGGQEDKSILSELYEKGVSNDREKEMVINMVMKDEVLTYLENLLDKLKEKSISHIKKLSQKEERTVECYLELINNVVRI